MLEKLAQFKRTCVDTGHDFAYENGIWVSTKMNAKERDEAKGGGAGDVPGRDRAAPAKFGGRPRVAAMFRIRRPYNSDSPSLSREHLVKNYRKLTPEELQAGGLGGAHVEVLVQSRDGAVHTRRRRCRRRAHGGVCGGWAAGQRGVPADRRGVTPVADGGGDHVGAEGTRAGICGASTRTARWPPRPRRR